VKNRFKINDRSWFNFQSDSGGTNVYLAVEQGAKIDASGTAMPILYFKFKSRWWGGINYGKSTWWRWYCKLQE
jgi:hypothetical protein